MRIAIIGGGPSGLAAAKALHQELVDIDLYERRDQIGGVWYHGGDKSKLSPSIPSPSLSESIEHTDGTLISSIYKYMETNLHSKLMEFTDVDLNENTPAYPTRQAYLEYLDKYSKLISPSVNVYLNTEVILVRKNDFWEVEVERRDPPNHVDLSPVRKASLHSISLLDSTSLQETPSLQGTSDTTEYDAVVVANGHFNVPFIPDVPGLTTWNKDDITHSRYFDDPEDYKGFNVLVVGNSSSGLDIAAQLSASSKTVFVSSREPLPDNDLIKYIQIVETYNYQEKSVRTVDGQTYQVDKIVFCTGYFYDLPFLKDPNIITNGLQVHNLYKQVFYIYDPSLVFIALNKNAVIMPLAEAQVALVARAFTGRYKLPDIPSMEEAYKQELKLKGPGRRFHELDYPKDVEYCQELRKILVDNNLYEGFLPDEWDKKKLDIRGNAKVDKEARMKLVYENIRRLRRDGRPYELLDSSCE